MTRIDDHSGLIALNRFGYGARGGDADDLRDAGSDPRGYVLSDLSRPDGAILQATELPDSPVLLRRLYDFQADQKMEREQKASVAPAAQKAALPKAEGKPVPAQPNVVQQSYRDEALARFRRASRVDVGFVERLVAFWSNHFAVAVDKSQIVRIAAGAFEREAIRPHVLGRFSDMVRAVEQHPVMLNYLDNQLSIGPDSRAGRNRNRGLNENLAREIMELHTVGVNGGYTQADVTSFAKILTGWTIVGRQGRIGEPGTFAFLPNAHEPGPQTLLGRVYDENGVRQGETALNDLTRRPSTATFIATKLARHFVADDPPPALVARLAQTFRKTDGDLRAVSAALVNSDESWRAPSTKLRNPYEFLIASARLFGRMPENPQPTLGAMVLLGMPLWNPPGPNGFPDDNSAWLSPEGVKLRVDIASRLGKQAAAAPFDPNDLTADMFGDAVSPETREAVSRAESKEQAYALLIMSPEFQRR